MAYFEPARVFTVQSFTEVVQGCTACSLYIFCVKACSLFTIHNLLHGRLFRAYCLADCSGPAAWQTVQGLLPGRLFRAYCLADCSGPTAWQTVQGLLAFFLLSFQLLHGFPL